MGATPVLVTSIVRRLFDAEGKFRPDTLVPYAEAVRRLAVERKVALIDLYTLTREQAERLGPAGSETLGRKDAQGKPDRTHLGPKGQTEIGAMAAREFARVAPEVGAVPARSGQLAQCDAAAGGLVRQRGGGADRRQSAALPARRRRLGQEHRHGVRARDRRSARRSRKRRATPRRIPPSTTTPPTRRCAIWRGSTPRPKQPRFAASFRRGFEYLIQGAISQRRLAAVLSAARRLLEPHHLQ